MTDKTDWADLQYDALRLYCEISGALKRGQIDDADMASACRAVALSDELVAILCILDAAAAQRP